MGRDFGSCSISLGGRPEHRAEGEARASPTPAASPAAKPAETGEKDPRSEKSPLQNPRKPSRPPSPRRRPARQESQAEPERMFFHPKSTEAGGEGKEEAHRRPLHDQGRLSRGADATGPLRRDAAVAGQDRSSGWTRRPKTRPWPPSGCGSKTWSWAGASSTSCAAAVARLRKAGKPVYAELTTADDRPVPAGRGLRRDRSCPRPACCCCPASGPK